MFNKFVTLLLLLLLATLTTSSVHSSSLLQHQPFLPNIFGLQTYNLTDMVSSNIAPWNTIYTVGEWFGAFPVIQTSASGNTWCFGGIPQRANISYHQEKIKSDLLNVAKISPDFEGVIIVDYESWHFTWNLTGALYQNMSIEYVKQQFPNQINDTEFLHHQAAIQYKQGVESFITATVQGIRNVIPKSKIGFYGYGGAMGYWINVTERQQLNDVELNFLWPQIDVLATSLYLPYKSGIDVPYARNLQYIQQNLAESTRLKMTASSSLMIIPYCWHRYHPGEPSGGQFLTAQDMMLEYNYPLFGNQSIAADAVIMWGDESQSTQDEKDTLNLLIKNKAAFENSASFNEHAVEADNIILSSLLNNNNHHRSNKIAGGEKNRFINSQNDNFPPWRTCSL